MEEVSNRTDVTWSSVEKDVPYNKVTWYTDKSGIPRYIFSDEEGNSIN